MAQQLYEQWFRLADEDKDGAVGGAEAVRFFMRSGLQQAVLGQVGRMIRFKTLHLTPWAQSATGAWGAHLFTSPPPNPQIWDLSSGGGPKLNQFQFSSAMRLVALAQVSPSQR